MHTTHKTSKYELSSCQSDLSAAVCGPGMAVSYVARTRCGSDTQQQYHTAACNVQQDTASLMQCCSARSERLFCLLRGCIVTGCESFVERSHAHQVMAHLPHLLLRRLVAADKNIPVHLHRVAGHDLAAEILAERQRNGRFPGGRGTCVVVSGAAQQTLSSGDRMSSWATTLPPGFSHGRR